MFYYSANKTPLINLVKAALCVAKKQNHDVFTCLSIMDNIDFADVKFNLIFRNAYLNKEK
jgi:hypothetical protein